VRKRPRHSEEKERRNEHGRVVVAEIWGLSCSWRFSCVDQCGGTLGGRWGVIIVARSGLPTTGVFREIKRTPTGRKNKRGGRGGREKSDCVRGGGGGGVGEV